MPVTSAAINSDFAWENISAYVIKILLICKMIIYFDCWSITTINKLAFFRLWVNHRNYQKYNIFRQFYVYFPSCTVKKLCDIIVTENAHRRQNPAMAACGHDMLKFIVPLYVAKGMRPKAGTVQIDRHV